MTKSPWAHPPITGTPLDYAPIDAPIIHGADDTPERTSRLWGLVTLTGALIGGAVLVGFTALGLVTYVTPKSTKTTTTKRRSK
jgi:hypothetical protein